MGEQNLHRFKAESGTGELMRGSFCEGQKFRATFLENSSLLDQCRIIKNTVDALPTHGNIFLHLWTGTASSVS